MASLGHCKLQRWGSRKGEGIQRGKNDFMETSSPSLYLGKKNGGVKRCSALFDAWKATLKTLWSSSEKRLVFLGMAEQRLKLLWLFLPG